MNDLTPFDPRPLVSEAQGEVLVQTREAYKALHAQLLTLPPSRERAVALTELETSSMWATKAITHGWPDITES